MQHQQERAELALVGCSLLTMTVRMCQMGSPFRFSSRHEDARFFLPAKLRGSDPRHLVILPQRENRTVADIWYSYRENLKSQKGKGSESEKTGRIQSMRERYEDQRNT